VERPMFWLDVNGATTPLRAAGADWLNPRFSPDGRRIAMSITSGGQSDLWIYDWARDAPTKFTFDSANDGGPVWSPDGRRLAFYSDRATRGINQLYWQRSDGGGDVQRLTTSAHPQQAASFHPSGKYLAFTETAQAGNGDLMILPIDGDETTGWKPGTPTVFLSTPANEQFPVFSLDGRWISYMSDESGQMQTYVRSFPGPGGKQLVSASGLGIYPVWSRVKHELFFLDPVVSKIMVAGYSADAGSFVSEKPRVWSAGVIQMLGTSRTFDMHPDMKRAVIGRQPESEQRAKVVFVVNFFEELRRMAAGK
jgi:Tol biopolymer transport system component